MNLAEAERPTASPHIVELDGLRGIAVCAVLFYHAAILWKTALGPLARVGEFAWVGVDVFFALSGFLITGILLRATPGAKALKHFYIKRGLRIWPLYYALLLLTAFESRHLHFYYPFRLSIPLLQNFVSAWPHGHFDHTWSLCVEEHFYLLWPIVVFLVPRRRLPAILTLVLLASPCLRWYFIQHNIPTKLLYTASPFRFDSIAIGSLMAFLLAEGKLTLGLMKKFGHIALLLGALPAVLLFRLNPVMHGQRSAVLYSFLAIASAGMLAVALAFRDTAAGSLLRWTPLRYTGKISYGLYMLHPFVFGFLAHSAQGSIGLALALSISFAVAALSWRFFESPIVNLKRRLTDTPRGEPQFHPVSGANGAQETNFTWGRWSDVQD